MVRRSTSELSIQVLCLVVIYSREIHFTAGYMDEFDDVSGVGQSIGQDNYNRLHWQKAALWHANSGLYLYHSNAND